MELNDFSQISLQQVGAALAALSALATAAFGLLDSTKAFWGGVSNIGLGHLWRALTPYDAALNEAVGRQQWRLTVRANWINGMAKDQQKAVVGALLKLGLTAETARSIAAASNVDADALATAARKLEAGEELEPAQVNILGRMSVSIEATLDAAFEAAEQQYRNVSRVLAGLACVGLALLAQTLMPGDQTGDYLLAVTVGLLAVPLAPVAKDLTSALSAAMRALKASRAI